MTAPWYLAPDAIETIGAIIANPPATAAARDEGGTERHSYTGILADQLAELWHAALSQTLAACQKSGDFADFNAVCRAEAQDVIASVLGEHLPGVHFLSDMDRLAEIAGTVAAARLRRAA